MKPEEWVLDVSMSPPVWIPIENRGTDDETLVTGLNYMGEKPPGKVVGIVHPDGQDAVDRWCSANPDEVERVKALASRSDQNASR